jgi:putative chitinase
MNIHELDSYNLGDAVKFHRRLNPRIWGRDEHLLPEVREKLLAIAADFQEFLGVEDLDVQDITISGSNAAYSYTKNSDIDLHLVVKMPDNPVYQELFNAKKYQYNDEHNIRIGGADVELYVQPADQAHHSQGIYSIQNNKWLQVPQRKRAQIDDACVRDKVADLDSRIHAAVKSHNQEVIGTLWNKIKDMRKSGLEQHGEFGCENIAFKMLRNKGCIRLLKDAMTAAQDRELSLREAPQQKFRYGFSEGMQSQPYSTSDGVAASTKQFLEDSNNDSIVQDFIQHVTAELGIDPQPKIVLHTNPEWSEHNHSFGRYDPDSHTLNVSMPNRHVLDVLRTVAHELVHCSQNQQHNGLPDDAGETGSRWENDANARAGIIMRDWANTHPEHFAHEPLEENASGYIPKNKREAAMPQYAMALSVDIKPGQVGKEANKLALKTGRNGEPGLLQPDAQNLLREFSEFVEEQENLFEISMSPSSLKKLSAQTGALAGMEFEMIVPNVEGNDDGDQEPDYEYDERCRSIEDAVQFFYDGDFNGRRDVERLRERMQNDFSEWLDDKIYREWERHGEEYLEEWVPNNVDESEWNPEGLEGEERQEALEEFIANLHADPGGSNAFDEYREENQESYDESDWLDDEDLDRMSSIENAYSMNWPHWTTVGQGEGSIEQVADNFSDAIGRPVQASSSYHSGSVQRPSTKNPHYIVEPDSSLDPDDNNDQGLEFVSPPMPIEELLSDLNKVKAWADKTGCYTNDSTGLHINVSVPGWSGGSDQLDYVKLAVLLGDEHVLESFGRAGNTYCKSAMGKIQTIIRQNPAKAEEMLERMRQGMDQLASKAIHSGTTDKYTSINNKNGYIEFRSPGGDWLNDNFAEIDNTLRRFTVALSAAVDPEAYRKEYLKKLYKLLDVHSEKDPLSYFAKFAAGELPRAALKSFVRQAQLERDVKRGKDKGPMWWRVYKEGKGARNGAVIEVVASSREEAIDTAAEEWGMGNNEYRRAMYAEPLRPYVETKGPELNGRPSNPDGNYVIVNASTSEPAYRYMASDMTDALLVLRQWITANPGTQWDFKRDPEMRLGQPGSQGVDTSREYELYDRRSGAVVATFQASDDDAALQKLDQFRAGQVRTQGITVPQANEIYGVRSSGIVRVPPRDRPSTEPIPGSTLDLQRQRQAAASGQTAMTDVEPDLSPLTSEPPPQPAGMGQWNGQWKVLVGGQEVYRFGGIGNSQADANRIAAAWLRQNGQGVSGEGFEVYPVMDESLREYKMPQPSHGPGKYRDLNEPLGPETPPEMPDGTIKVDVSDMYDWYKLGQKISDLDSIKPGELGQGPPSTVFAFGSEDLENLYSHELTRLGLKTHDLDEPGEEDIDEGVKSALATGALAGAMALGAQAKAPDMVQQIVEPGDTVYSIARQNGVNPLEVYRLNKMDRNTKLEVGQKVLVPDYSKPIKPAATVKTTVAPAKAAPVAAPAQSFSDKITSMIPKFNAVPAAADEVTLLSNNSEAEAALQTAAKAAGLKGAELAQFMAQTRHESWDFGKMKEVGSKKQFAKYEKSQLARRLGNKVQGDGEKFKGRGFIQLTGRDNYTRASEQIFGDDRLVKNPDLASDLGIAAKIALWYWKNQVRPKVNDFNNTTQVVKAINADEPAKVIQARHNKFKEYMAVL